MCIAATIANVITAAAYFLKNVQVILNVFHTAVIRQMLEQFLDILFSGLHGEITH